MQETKKDVNSSIDDDDIIKNAYITYKIRKFYE